MDQLLAVHDPEKELSYEDLEMFTTNFSRENFMGRTQFGKVFRGKIPEGWKGMKAQNVTVKLWQPTTVYRKFVLYRAYPNEFRARVIDELNFLRQESHPNLAKVKGYCFEGDNFGVVFDINPLNTVRNLVAEGSFKWFHRMKVALALAHLLQFLHSHRPRYLLRNLSAAHIMLDQDYNPVLIDCAMLVGGSFGDRSKAGSGCPLGPHGYVDAYPLSTTGEWSEKSDIFAFGIILLELTCKCTFDWLPLEISKDCGKGFFLYHAARQHYHYEKSKFRFGKFKLSFINKGLEKEPDFHASDGPKITKLAIQCVDIYPGPRPTTKEVVENLEKLHYVCRNGLKMGFGLEKKDVHLTAAKKFPRSVFIRAQSWLVGCCSQVYPIECV